MTVRCVYIAAADANSNYNTNLVYMSEDDFLAPGIGNHNEISGDKLYSSDEFNYRLIIRNNHHVHSPHKKVEFESAERLWKHIRAYMGFWGARYYYTLTLVRYTDDTFTMPIDIPLDDPVIAKMKNYWSDEMRNRII